LVKNDGEKAKDWFTKRSSIEHDTYYDAYIVKTGFSNWIDDGDGKLI
jgi:hypothetical protein